MDVWALVLLPLGLGLLGFIEACTVGSGLLFVHPVWAMIAMAASVTAVLLNSFGGRLLPGSRPPPVPFTLAGPSRHRAAL